MPLDVFQFNLTQKCGIIKYAIDKGQTDRQRVCLIKKKSRREFLLYLRGQPSKMNIKVRL